uniref:Nucleoporin-like protein 2 n=2 Tax=Callorhinchus milii TaxID=7868 RepID=V9KCI2_CALMI
MAELKKPNPSTRSMLLEELKRPNQKKPSLGFGGAQVSSFGSSGFGSSPANSNTFSFRPSAGLADPTTSSCFGNPASSSPAPSSFGAKAASSVFGNTSVFGASPTPAPVTSIFCTTAPGAAPSSVFGSSAPFGSSSFGNPTACTFSSKLEKPEKATTNGFGTLEPATLSSTVCQPQSTPLSSSSVNGHGKLYTPRSELSADDLREFEAKRFTLGRIPLWPPPIELLNV